MNKRIFNFTVLLILLSGAGCKEFDYIYDYKPDEPSEEPTLRELTEDDYKPLFNDSDSPLPVANVSHPFPQKMVNRHTDVSSPTSLPERLPEPLLIEEDFHILSTNTPMRASLGAEPELKRDYAKPESFSKFIRRSLPSRELPIESSVAPIPRTSTPDHLPEKPIALTKIERRSPPLEIPFLPFELPRSTSPTTSVPLNPKRAEKTPIEIPMERERTEFSRLPRRPFSVPDTENVPTPKVLPSTSDYFPELPIARTKIERRSAPLEVPSLPFELPCPPAATTTASHDPKRAEKSPIEMPMEGEGATSTPLPRRLAPPRDNERREKIVSEFEVPSRRESISFTQETILRKFNLIFIVDNSASMNDVKDFMQSNLKRIIEPLALRRKHLDWRAAITTVDPSPSFQKVAWHLPRTFIRTRAGTSYVGTDRPLGAREWDALQLEWTAMVSKVIETDNAWWEQGLKSAELTFENDGAELMKNRENSHTVFIWLSDENDYSAERGFPFQLSPQDPNRSLAPESHPELWTPTSLDRHIDRFREIEKKTGGDVLLYPVVHNDREKGTACDKEPSKTPSVGLRYLDLVDRWNRGHEEFLRSGVGNRGTGKALSICEENLKSSFDTIADLTADRDVCYDIDEKWTKIQVTVNGTSVPEHSENGFVVKRDRGARVCFYGGSIPSVGATITVSGMTR